jgi:hypothetical protein
MSCQDGFIECTSLSFSYDVMGIVTLSYTMVHPSPDPCYETTITAGGYTFNGYVTNIGLSQIVGTAGWYETNVTLLATTN